MWALLVEALDEGIEPRLLLQHVAGGRLGGFLFQGQMHPLVPAVLLRLAGGDALNLNPEARVVVVPETDRVRGFHAGIGSALELSFEPKELERIWPTKT